MKKNYLWFLFIAVVLNGCINYEQVTTVRADNSGEMYIHYWTKIKLPIDSTIFGRIGAFNRGEIKKIFNFPDVKLKETEIYIDEEDSTLHAKIQFDFRNINNLRKLEPFKGSRISVVNGHNGNKKFTQFVTPFTFPFEFNSGNYFAEYTYYLPGKILNSNADDISLNRLHWKFKLKDLQNGKILTATFRPFRLPETPAWIYYLAGFVLLIVIYFLFSKKYT